MPSSRQVDSGHASCVSRYWRMSGCYSERTDPCVFKFGDAGNGRAILVVHVDDILIGGSEGDVPKVGKILNEKFPTNNPGEVTWRMGCAVDGDLSLIHI